MDKKKIIYCVSFLVIGFFLVSILGILVKNPAEDNVLLEREDLNISSVFRESFFEVTDGTSRETGFEEFTSVNSNYGNELLRWGILRKGEGNTPAADPGAPELLEKHGGFYIGDTNKKEVYLTFDEGYENGYTDEILDVLKKNNVQGVFFITGPYLQQHEDLVRRMVEEGHIVGNHTVNHPSLPSLGDEELKKELKELDEMFYEKFGERMKYLRPPKGEYSERTLKVTNELGYVNMFWSFAYDDWYRDKVRGADYAYNKVMNNLHNGAVILLHAVSKDNADALDRIIKGIKEKGFTIGSVDNIKVD